MTRVLWIALLSLGAAACGVATGSTDSRDAASDATTDAGVDVPTCDEALQGAQPFSRTVTGELEFTIVDYRGGERTVRDTLALDVYFPQGLTPRAPVILAAQVYGGFHSTSGVLGDDATGELAWNGIIELRGRYVTANISAAGIWADVEENFADPGTDIGSMGDGRGLLCPSGATPGPALVATAQLIGPLSRLLIGMTVPIDAATLAAQASTASGQLAVAAHVETTRVALEEREAIELQPIAGVFPLNEDLDVEFAGLTDVLGRAIPHRFTFRALRTSATLVDLEFDSVPDGAIASTCRPIVAGGVLTLSSMSGGGGLCTGEHDYLIQLSAPEGATKLEIAFKETSYSEPWTQEFALIRQDGSHTRATRDDEAQGPLSLDIPEGSGPIWLAIHLHFSELLPQYLSLAHTELAIERVAFR